jgi:hypothetical protein
MIYGSFLLRLLKMLGTGYADGKKRWVPAPLRVRGMDDGPGQGWMDRRRLVIVMKSFSKTHGKKRKNRRNTGPVRQGSARRRASRRLDPAGLAWLRARRTMGSSAGSLPPHSMSLVCMPCLPAFIIDTGQSAASMALS